MATSPLEQDLDMAATLPSAARMMFHEDETPASSPVNIHASNLMSKDAIHQDGELTQETANAPKEADNDASQSSEEDSDLDIRRPVGRAARRMLGGDRCEPGGPKQRAPATRPSLLATLDNSDDELYSSTPRRVVRPQSKSPSVRNSVARSTLFVSPARTAQDGSDDDLPQPSGLKSKLAALVAEKRAARLAREAEEESRHSDPAHASSDLPDDMVQGSQDPVDPEVERIMSDAARPTRKASKRALLEMERETQRMARQQALAHQMKTRKKFTTNELFAKFNYRPVGQAISPITPVNASTSSAPSSEVVEASAREPVSTPPSSPPTPLDRQRALVERGALSKLVPVREDSLAGLAALEDEDLPDIAHILSSAREAKAAQIEAANARRPADEAAPKKGLKLARLGKKAMAPPTEESSDDDLEIVKDIPHHLNVFDKAKGTMKRQHADSTAIHRLKHLAHIGMDESRTARRKNGKATPSVPPQVLEQQLRARAKDQARAQQLERIAELKAKGIDVQTAEEREREQEMFENLLEKARQEAVDLRKAEKNAAKGENGEAAVSDDESEDEDYVDGSGSEDEQPEREGNEMVEDEADESDEEEAEEDGEEAEAGSEQEDDEQNAEAETEESSHMSIDESPSKASLSQTPVIGRKPRRTRVVLDEDEDDSGAQASQPLRNATPTATSTQEDPFAAFGFGATKPASSLMSPTQMFNATMQTPTQLTQQESLDALNNLVPPTSSSLPPLALDFESQQFEDSQVSMVPASQVADSQPIKLAWETQPPETPVQTMTRGSSNMTLATPGWEPSQDAGLPEAWQAIADDGLNLASHDTQSTVPLRISESPAVAVTKRNRLMRGKRPVVEDSDGDDDDVPAQSLKQEKKNAFREMARKRREALTEAERAEAEREVKQMMEDQAEESEDEYAGLGGDDYVAPETEQDREMIDSSYIEVDKQQLAAHFAERQRAEDEAGANKLLRDLQTGALRRKQGNMFDLDDDEDDLAVRRRQMRQREEARKRKLLLQDDNIAGLAEGKQSKGKDAFLRAIADDDDRDDDTMDLSDAEADGDQTSQSDSQASQQPSDTQPPLRAVSGNKRRMEEDSQSRPPAKHRRTEASAFKAPRSILEIQESVSFLLDEPNIPTAAPTAPDLSSDSDSENEDDLEGEADDDDYQALQEESSRQNDGGFAPDRLAMPPPRLPASQRRTAPIIDRLSLKRDSSAQDQDRDTAHPRTAWASPAGARGGFKVPSLLRRATTNTAAAFGANDRGVTTSLSRENSGSSSSSSGVKMGGTKKSSLAYQAREGERLAIVQAGAQRRAENTARIALLRRNATAGASFGKGFGGSFE